MKAIHLTVSTFCRGLFFIVALHGLGGCSDGGPSPEKEQTSGQEGVKSTATLSLGEGLVSPGGSLAGRIALAIPDGWHTYSDPPGDSGMPPIIDFELPPGWSSSILPLPEARRFEGPAGVTFGYENTLEIDFLLTAPQQAPGGEKETIRVSVQWLTCKDICLPWSQDFEAEVTVAESND
jgi:thiol:disulfide interchange protein DsbD